MEGIYNIIIHKFSNTVDYSCLPLFMVHLNKHCMFTPMHREGREMWSCSENIWIITCHIPLAQQRHTFFGLLIRGLVVLHMSYVYNHTKFIILRATIYTHTHPSYIRISMHLHKNLSILFLFFFLPTRIYLSGFYIRFFSQ